MSEEEVEIFHGNRPPDRAEGVKKAKPKATTVVAEPDVASAAEAEADELNSSELAVEADHLAAEHAETAEAIDDPEPEYYFDIDPESLWTMPPAMQERISNLASASAVTNERLDDQEKTIAKINKALKQLA